MTSKWKSDSAALLLCLVLGVPAAAGPLEDGSAAYAKGDYVTALRLLRPLAAKGLAKAEYTMGLMYANGRGVAQDFVEAAKWYRKGAVQRDIGSEFNLAVMYDNGIGVKQDNALAAKWYRSAADQGDAKAEFNLGTMFVYGEGVKTDNVEAYKWFEIAAARFSAAEADKRKDAVLQRDVLAEKMTPAQIAEAKKRAGAWKPK